MENYLFSKVFTTGVVTSPNHPGNYPDKLRKTQTIQVAQGLVLSLQFTAFDIQYDSLCSDDHLTITDGDGTILMGRSSSSSSPSSPILPAPARSCGSSLPANITSRTNTVNLMFTTDERDTRSGWSVSWSTVTDGERI